MHLNESQFQNGLQQSRKCSHHVCKHRDWIICGDNSVHMYSMRERRSVRTAFTAGLLLPRRSPRVVANHKRKTVCSSSAPPRQVRRQRQREIQRQERKRRGGLGFAADREKSGEEIASQLWSDNEVDEDSGPMPQHILNCVVKIYCTHGIPNYSMPWAMQRQRQSTSSGFILSDRRIITCAHCVEHHTVVMVKRRGSDVKYPAIVVAIGNECDTAWLEVRDPAFWDDAERIASDSDNLPYLKPGKLPNLQDICAVIGYPSPGENISITQGVCSRIEMQGYVYATSNLLAVQLDAAINGGNSGGPVLNDRWECVGIAFQSIDPAEADSIGYFIPYTVVKHFLDDIQLHGRYTGFPGAGFSYQKMENECMRKALNLPNLEDGNGILVKSVNATSDASRILKRGDIVTHLDGVAVSNAGTVPFTAQEGERISLTYLITSMFVNDEIAITFYRDGRRYTDKYRLPAMGGARLVPRHIHRQYIVHGGLVFTTLSEPYLRSEFDGEEFLTQAPVGLIQQYYYGRTLNDGRTEIVLLAHVLNSSINAGYQDVHAQIVCKFNGIPVKNLAHLAQLLDICEADDTVDWLHFELDHDEVVILDKRRVASEMPQILETHCIPKARHIATN